MMRRPDDVLEAGQDQSPAALSPPYPPAAGAPRKAAPPKAEVLQWPVFPGLTLQDIAVPRSAAECQRLLPELLAEPVLGFDTEVRPTFDRGAEPRGPDVVQFSSGTRAYVLQLCVPGAAAVVRAVLEAKSVLKVGFDLHHDQEQLARRLGTRARPLLDLDVAFHAQGYQRNLGIKSAVAVLFGQRLMKSKRTTTSNWSARQLEPRQVLYAANDAYAAWAVLQALQLPLSDLPIWPNGRPPAQPGATAPLTAPPDSRA